MSILIIPNLIPFKDRHITTSIKESIKQNVELYRTIAKPRDVAVVHQPQPRDTKNSRR